MNKLLIILLLIPSVAAAYRPYNRPPQRPSDSMRNLFDKVTREPQATEQQPQPTRAKITPAPISQLLRTLELPIYRGTSATIFVYDQYDVITGEHCTYGFRVLIKM
jgi:hypothetical protein